MKIPKITPIAASPWTDLLPHGISDHDKLIHQAFLQARGLGDRHGFGERCREVLKEEAYASISLERELGFHEEHEYIMNVFFYAPELLGEWGKNRQAKGD